MKTKLHDAAFVSQVSSTRNTLRKSLLNSWNTTTSCSAIITKLSPLTIRKLSISICSWQNRFDPWWRTRSKFCTTIARQMTISYSKVLKDRCWISIMGPTLSLPLLIPQQVVRRRAVALARSIWTTSWVSLRPTLHALAQDRSLPSCSMTLAGIWRQLGTRRVPLLGVIDAAVGSTPVPSRWPCASIVSLASV